VTQGECSRYVVNVHPVLSMELCATRGECSSYTVNVHPVLAMEVCATGGMFEVCS
jgi:hypothetical protein